MGRSARRLKRKRVIKFQSSTITQLEADIKEQVEQSIVTFDPREIDAIISRIPTKSPDGSELIDGVEMRAAISRYADEAISKHFQTAWGDQPVDMMARLNQVWEHKKTVGGPAATEFVDTHLRRLFAATSEETVGLDQVRSQCIDFWATVLIEKGREFQAARRLNPWVCAFEAVLQRMPRCLEVSDTEIGTELRVKAVERSGRAITHAVNHFNGWREIAERGLIRRDTVRFDLTNHIDVDETFDFAPVVANEVDRRNRNL